MVKNKFQTLKGFRDFLPEDWKIQSYIFNTWREVCLGYGFEEYQGPTLEYIDIYNKSGQDVGTGGKELYSFDDKGGRRVALRPELTPSVGRIVAANQSRLIRPVKWFSIGNFFRAENPQRGRTREFWQLNADIFGSESLLSDFEIISLAVDIMLAFGATENMFKVFINNRLFSDFYFKEILELKSEDDRNKLLKIIDAYPKRDDEWLKDELSKTQGLEKKFDGVKSYCNLTIKDLDQFSENKGAEQLLSLFEFIKKAGIDKYCSFNSLMARGLDYYTGMVFEVFDQSPENNRAMFGGGRYDDLLDIFDAPKIPAVGFAPGNIPTTLFLESWDLLPKDISTTPDCLVTVFSEDTLKNSISVSGQLRREGLRVSLYPDMKATIQKQLSYADKKGVSYVVIIGPDEIKEDKLILKDLKTGEQKSTSLDKAVEILKNE